MLRSTITRNPTAFRGCVLSWLLLFVFASPASAQPAAEAPELSESAASPWVSGGEPWVPPEGGVETVVPWLPGEHLRFQPPLAEPLPAPETTAAPAPAQRPLPAGIAPVDEAPPEAPAAAETPSAAARAPGDVIKIILGLIAVVALAYLAGQPRVRRLEQRLGIAQVVTAGFPFIALGMIARLPPVGILTDPILVELSPVLHLALGWIGFQIGFRFDVRAFDTLPEGTAAKVAFSTGIPFLFVVAACALVLLGEAGWTVSLRDPGFLRDAIILGSASAITAQSAARMVTRGGPNQTRVLQIIRLDELGGIAGLIILAAYFRPPDEQVTWRLPGTAWVFITLGLGATVGLVAYAILRHRTSHSESVVLLLGIVAFAAGMASNLLLSPIAVCFVAGVLLVNFPGTYKEQVAATLAQLERPIFLLFLTIVGAMWSVGDWRGWVLMVVFVAARFVGNWIGVKAGWSQGELSLTRDERIVLDAAPMGQLSVAIVVSAFLLYPQQGTVRLIVTAVIGSAIVTEIAVQLLARKLHHRTREAGA